METIRTLETFEQKIGAHREKAMMYKQNRSEKISRDVDRVFYQKSKH